ncbi:spore germination cell wall hydrolase CwlJ-like protein [Caulobacter ginsengisoli]|uniref:Spore germination cell wall hydrolase CwlJ-like protein n=1 Tax=Caulobacter ginsengisoli TaxID=400775 RepID=A0ABU0IY36_9CAUL|nr:cell wall hydrolase [Caulobacter ginsengisoli]MDQ0466093.1 spore germination cell wall hydrolase CwlJ-like protein [Caulobacter ginsengisoli]
MTTNARLGLSIGRNWDASLLKTTERQSRRPGIWLAALALSGMLGGCLTDYRLAAGAGQAHGVASVARGFSEASFKRLTAGMDPAMRKLAARHDGRRKTDYWGRPIGWGSYDLSRLPTLGVGVLTAEEAMRLNALRTGDAEPPPPARPFVFKGSAEDRALAEDCLTKAIYYEAAVEPGEGQQAVAQVILNRLRHPGYPKSICGVVFEGSLRPTGCQFSFTCDGSLARVPDPRLWANAQAVAKRALSGFVMKAVGTATHYHADYVAPYWAPTLYKIVQIGRHIFYRWTGPAGMPAAFTGRYAGGEANLSTEVLTGYDPRIAGAQLLNTEGAVHGLAEPRTVTLTVDGEERTYTVNASPANGEIQIPVQGALNPSRPKPTPEQIKQINAEIEARTRTFDDPDAPIGTAPRDAPPRPLSLPPVPPSDNAGDLPLSKPK